MKRTMPLEACPKHELLAARGLVSAKARSGTSRKTASVSSSRRTDLFRQERSQGDFLLFALGPRSDTDDDGEWTEYLPARQVSDSASRAYRHQVSARRASGTEVSGRWSFQRQLPDFDMAERGDVESNEEAPDEKEDENVEGEGTGGDGVASTEDAELLSVSKEDVDKPSLEAAAGAAQPQHGDVFERLRQAQHAVSPSNEIVFSVQQENDRWLVVFLVAGLYVFFYAIGGLAYYLLDEYGYTVAYSGRANHSNGNTEEPLGARHH